jgi:hypothetical protein
MAYEETDDFEIGSIVDASEVPNWARRQPKWKKLIDAISQLTPGQSLTVNFADEKAAIRARNTVRDTLNMQLGTAAIRTRVVNQDDGKAVVFFTRLHEADIVEEKRQTPE